MGLLQIWGGHGVFFDGGGRRSIDSGSPWSLLAFSGITGSKVFVVISVLLRGLCVSWVGVTPGFLKKTKHSLYVCPRSPHIQQQNRDIKTIFI
jgi:hypothetical protein